MNFLRFFFLNSDIPLLALKRSAFEIADLPGLWRVHWQWGNVKLISTFYTRHDQACLLWGLLALCIFVVAQFLMLDWHRQCWLWSGLTVVAIVSMVNLTADWAKGEQLEWLLYTWAILMILGLVITDLSVFGNWGILLGYLCPMWLGISAIGYGFTAWGMRSRAFLLIGLFHLISILILPYTGSWYLLTTGAVIGISLLMVAELQWDARGVCGQTATPEGYALALAEM